VSIEDATPPPAAAEGAITEVEVRDAPLVPPPGTMEGRKGCLLAILLGVVFGLGSVGLGYLSFRYKTGAVLEASEELAGVIAEAEKQPGAAALRTRGCDAAGVIGAVDLRTIGQKLEDARAKKEKRAAKQVDVGPDERVVYCAVKGSRAPSCAELAQLYVAEARPEKGFVVTSRTPMVELCAEGFDAKGASLGAVPTPKLPQLVEAK
jgi:hypothetical protein